MPRKERDEKRRDSKGRLLKSGESQRSDGRYAYKYTDTFGNPQFVYSWKLVPTDKIPAGKRPDISLREKVKQIQQDIADGIDPIGKKMTVCQLYAKYIRQRGNVKRGTKKSRQQLMKLLSDDKLGAASIDSVKLSDAKEWALRMQEKGIAYHTICNSKRSLKAIFYMAIQDDCIRKNPFDFPINDVINDDTEPKVPLTPAQEEELLKFMQDDPVYARRILIDQLLLHERNQDLPGDLSGLDEIGEQPAHMLRGRRQRESCGLRLFSLCALPSGRSVVAAQQTLHRLRIGQVTEVLEEGHRPAAPLRLMVIPLAAAYGDAVVAGHPLLPTRGEQPLSASKKELLQVHAVGPLLLLLGEMDVGHRRLLSGPCGASCCGNTAALWRCAGELRPAGP